MISVKVILSFFTPFYFYLTDHRTNRLFCPISMSDSSSLPSLSSSESESVSFAPSFQNQTSESLSVSLVSVVLSLLSFTVSCVELRSELASDFLFLKDCGAVCGFPLCALAVRWDDSEAMAAVT